MEPTPSANNPEAGKHAQLSNSIIMSGTTQHILVQEQSVLKSAQFDKACHINHPNVYHAVEDTIAHTAAEILSSNNAADLDHDSKVAFTALTTQALHEHDENCAITSILPNFLIAGREDLATSMQVEGTDTLSNMTLIDNHSQSPVDSRHQTQSQRHSSASMYIEGGFKTTVWQDTCCWSRSPNPEDIVGALGHGENNGECLLWNADQGRELTAWGNELAGVGEHFAAYDCQGYNGCGDLVVD